MKRIILFLFFLSVSLASARTPDTQSEANYFNSIEEDIQWFEYLDATIDHDEPRMLFANIYHEVTLEMPKLFSEHKFENPDWVLKLMLKYVSLYKHALDCSYQKECTLSPAWVKAFQTHQDGQTKPAIQLLLSISAHVNRDLPIALAAVETDFKNKSLERDYKKIAMIFDRRMTNLIKVLRGHQRCRVRWIDRKLIDRVIRWAMNSTRDQSWANAHKLSLAKNFYDEMKILKVIEEYTAKQNKFILRYAPAGEFGICN